MLYLESFLHRVQLAEIVSRWVVDKPEPDDVRKLKKIVNFNSYIARLWGDELATRLLEQLHGQRPQSFICKRKGQLKDFIVETGPERSTPRIAQLFDRYRRHPEDYYRDTPYDGRAYFLEGTDGSRRYVGSTRIKRFRRIAEKGSRRIVDYLFERIRANADALAEERARRLGIPKHALITAPEEQVAEFLDAERRLLDGIKQGSIQHEFPILSIPDVVGIKVIIEGDQFERLVDSIDNDDSCKLLEVEHHTGRYNAINLRAAYTLPLERLARQRPGPTALRVLSYRGFDPQHVHAQYDAFLESAEEQVLLEIIVSSYEEFLESEIGRSMHEDRIIEQRANREYNAHLATNVLYLMDYILALCLSPFIGEITDVPIKLWVKYMPDTMDLLFRQLFRLPVDASFDDANGEHTDPESSILAPAITRALVP